MKEEIILTFLEAVNTLGAILLLVVIMFKTTLDKTTEVFVVISFILAFTLLGVFIYKLIKKLKGARKNESKMSKL